MGKSTNYPSITTSKYLEILRFGSVEIEGQFVASSNYTFLAHVKYQQFCCKAVYKPQKGETPLWDFPAETLASREEAAYLVSEALGWNLVPPTVLRSEGPLGEGSLQLFIQHDPSFNYFTFPKTFKKKLKHVAVFDIVLNNADRKGSHILVDDNEKIWLIDHGICFHHKPKLRTVIWDFIEEEVPNQILQDLRKFSDQIRSKGPLSDKLDQLLSFNERIALFERTMQLIRSPIFPAPQEDIRPFPYPLV